MITARVLADEMTKNGEQDNLVRLPVDALRVDLADRRSDLLLSQVVEAELSERVDECGVLGLGG